MIDSTAPAEHTLVFGFGEKQQCSLPTKSRTKEINEKNETDFYDGVAGSEY